MQDQQKGRNMIFSKRLMILSILIIVFLFLSCAAKIVQVKLVPGKTLNSGGNALRILILQLKDDSKLKSISSEDFWKSQNIESLLGESLIEKTETTLYPETVKPHEITLIKETKFVAFVGDFFTPDPNKWYKVINVEDLEKPDGIGFLDDSIILVKLKE